MQMTGNPRALISLHNHVDVGPVSGPMRTAPAAFDPMNSMIASGAELTVPLQRQPMPSCGGLAPTAERTVHPARTIAESLTSNPGTREQNLPCSDLRSATCCVL